MIRSNKLHGLLLAGLGVLSLSSSSVKAVDMWGIAGRSLGYALAIRTICAIAVAQERISEETGFLAALGMDAGIVGVLDTSLQEVHEKGWVGLGTAGIYALTTVIPGYSPKELKAWMQGRGRVAKVQADKEVRKELLSR